MAASAVAGASTPSADQSPPGDRVVPIGRRLRQRNLPTLFGAAPVANAIRSIRRRRKWGWMVRTACDGWQRRLRQYPICRRSWGNLRRATHRPGGRIRSRHRSMLCSASGGNEGHALRSFWRALASCWPACEFPDVTAPRRTALGNYAAPRAGWFVTFIPERDNTMRSMFLGSLVAGLFAALTGLFAFAGQGRTAPAGCGCGVCACPDCDGEVCTCEVCGCTDCGCER